MAKIGKNVQSKAPQTKGTKGPSTTTAAATPEPKALAQVPVKTRPASIRSLITSCLAEGVPTDKIAERLKAEFPNSKAAEKSAKHIAFYRSKVKAAAKGEQAVK